MREKLNLKADVLCEINNRFFLLWQSTFCYTICSISLVHLERMKKLFCHEREQHILPAKLTTQNTHMPVKNKCIISYQLTNYIFM